MKPENYWGPLAYIEKYNLKINGILHVGAHICEELDAYKKYGLTDSQIVWVEGNSDIFNHIKRNNPKRRIFNVLISDRDNQETDFIITNNGQSSSILELKEHLREHPQVYEIKREKRLTKTIDTFISENQIESTLNFVNMDIQGAELLALKGMKNYLPYVNYLYLEVNVKELYAGCGLIGEIDDFFSCHSHDQNDFLTQIGLPLNVVYQ